MTNSINDFELTEANSDEIESKMILSTIQDFQNNIKESLLSIDFAKNRNYNLNDDFKINFYSESVRKLQVTLRFLQESQRFLVKFERFLISSSNNESLQELKAMLNLNKQTLNDLIESRKKFNDLKISLENNKSTNGCTLSLSFVKASMLAVAVLLPLDIYVKLKLFGCASISFYALYILFVSDKSSNKASNETEKKEMFKYSQLLADTTKFHEYLLQVFNNMLTLAEENPNEKNFNLERCKKLMEYNLEIIKTVEQVAITHKQYCNLTGVLKNSSEN